MSRLGFEISSELRLQLEEMRDLLGGIDPSFRDEDPGARPCPNCTQTCGATCSIQCKSSCVIDCHHGCGNALNP